MTKSNILDWDTTAANNTDVGGISILGSAPVSNFDGALRETMAQVKAGVDYKAVLTVKGSNYTAVANDNNAVIRATGALTLSLTAAATLGANWHCLVIADGGDVIIDPNSTELIDGASTITIPNGYVARVICSGTDFRTDRAWSTISTAITTLTASISNALIQLGTSAGTTSGTSVDYNSIPAGVKRITVMFNGVSLSGTDDLLVQIGPSGGVETTGYTSGSGSAVNSTAGFIMRAGNAARTASGTMTISNLSGSVWVEEHSINSGAASDFSGAGVKGITGTLSRVRITSTGSNTFDAGSVNISWEF